MKPVERPSNFSLYVARAMIRAYDNARRLGLSGAEASEEGVMVAEFIKSISTSKGLTHAVA
jgi:hypothetical protein